MSYYSLSSGQRTFVLVTFILCVTGLIVMWSVMGYKVGVRNANDPHPTPEQACMDLGGVPIFDGHQVQDCKFKQPTKEES